MDVRGTRRRHARIAGPLARNCVKLHPMTHIVGEYLAARVRQAARARGESRGLSSAGDVMGYSRPTNRRPGRRQCRAATLDNSALSAEHGSLSGYATPRNRLVIRSAFNYPPSSPLPIRDRFSTFFFSSFFFLPRVPPGPRFRGSPTTRT